MSAPHEHERSLDDDATGMRELLRSLPEPEPMPADLVARIQRALADEAARPPAAALDDHRSRRHPRRALHWAAAAGIVALAGTGLLTTTTGSDLLAAFGAGTGSGADSSTAVFAQDSPATAEDAPGARTGEERATAALPDGPRGREGTGEVILHASNTTWTGSDLTAAAATLLTTATPAPGSPAIDASSTGPIGSPAGARDCATALGVAAAATLFVDLGTHAGEPVALLVATTREGEQAAYLVGRHCRPGDPQLRLGPQTVTF